MIKQTFLDLFFYLAKPDPFIKIEKGKTIYKKVFTIFLISLALDFLVIGLSELLVYLKCLQPTPSSKLDDLENNKTQAFLLLVIIAPLLEEVIFRSQLRYLKAAVIISFLSVISLFFYILPVFNAIIVGIIVIAIMFIILAKLSGQQSLKFQIIKNCFPVYFYLIAIIFGLVHISNFLDPLKYGSLILIWVLPQVFAGFTLGYTRMRYGIYAAIVLHSLHNLTAWLALFIDT